MAANILLAEDDRALSALILDFFHAAGLEVLSVSDGEQALAAVAEQSFDLLILDVMMPHFSGLEVCCQVREDSSVPILFITALSQEENALAGFRAGADDYITKPFSMRELLARVKANIRRVAMSPAVPAAQSGLGTIKAGRVNIDRDRATVFKDGLPLELSQREYDLICFLAAQPGKVFSREALMEHVWNYEGYVGDVRAVDVAIRRLREKIEDDPANPEFIRTKRGMGYLFGE